MKQKMLAHSQSTAALRSTENAVDGNSLLDLARSFRESAQSIGAWFYPSWIDILLSYRSTFLGPLWILVGTGIFVFAIGTLYGRVVLTDGSNIYLAHLAVGYVIWSFVTQSISGSCNLFPLNQSSILDGAISYTDLILKQVTTNFIYLLHNALVVLVVFVVTGLMPYIAALLLLFTLPLVVANLLWICVIVAILGARFADLDELISSMLRLLFFLTPIIWIPHEHVRGAVVDAVLYLNPFYYFVEVIRAPLVYGQVPLFEIAVLIAVLPLGWLAASALYARTRTSIALWL